MKRFARFLGWKVGLAVVAIAVVVGLRIYDQTPHFRELKSSSRSVPFDLVLSEQLRPNAQNLKLKVYASERDGRPLRVFWLDIRDQGNTIDAKPGNTGVLCEHGDLAAGKEFELPPGHYLVCFELSAKELQNNPKPYHLTYSLYEFR